MGKPKTKKKEHKVKVTGKVNMGKIVKTLSNSDTLKNNSK